MPQIDRERAGLLFARKQKQNGLLTLLGKKAVY